MNYTERDRLLGEPSSVSSFIVMASYRVKKEGFSKALMSFVMSLQVRVVTQNPIVTYTSTQYEMFTQLSLSIGRSHILFTLLHTLNDMHHTSHTFMLMMVMMWYINC